MVSISIARAALPENGLTSAVGRASTKRVSQPSDSTSPTGTIRQNKVMNRRGKYT